MSIKSHNGTSQTDAEYFDRASAEGDSSFFNSVGLQASFGPVAMPSVTSAPPLVTPSAPGFEVPAIQMVSATAVSSGTNSGSATAPANSGATTATTASSTPAWVSTLQTASIAADMAAANVNGTVTYAGLEKLFADLDATLASTNSKLTTAEFNDLKTIAANLNNGMSTSAYLTSITKSLVNGSAANGTWTGGGTSSVALGNLAAGATATQLGELIGKWFLGTDLPSSKVLVEGSSFSVSYAASTKPLFASTGPSMNDINQGALADCYLLSGLAEVAYQNSAIISSMFTANGNDTYGVRFYVNGTAQYVTVNSSLAGNTFNSGSDIWASLAEKAYAQLQASGVVTGNSLNYGNSFSTIGNGGAAEMALEEITGASVITDFCASGGSWLKVVYNSSFGVSSYSTGNSTASVLSFLQSALAEGDDLVLSSYTNASSGGKITLVANHAMSIYGYDSMTGMLQIRNPWGTEAGQSWATTFEVSLSTLLADGDVITVDNAGTGKAAAPSAPVVSAQTATQTWKLGQAVNFTLASNTFTDPQGSKLTYSASLASGAALPSWLSFNASTQTFTGTVPVGTSGLSIKVTATDSLGLSTSETFAVATPAPPPPVVTAQTAGQTWTVGQKINLTLAANTFTDPQGEALTYSVTQSNGSALPTWLVFNSATHAFTGTAPSAATSLTLRVTATDAGGSSASETFGVTIASKASSFLQAIASLTSGSSTSSLSSQPQSANPQTLASPLS